MMHAVHASAHKGQTDGHSLVVERIEWLICTPYLLLI